MNKRGITIIEILISLTIISIVILLLVKVMVSLNKVNNDETYASKDEIKRTEIIKNIENDFLELKLEGIELENKKIIFKYSNETKELKIDNNKLIYNNEVYELMSPNATYNPCFKYTYQELDDDYYLVTLNIEVLIKGVNTTINDDISLTYLELKNENNSYPLEYTCQNN